MPRSEEEKFQEITDLFDFILKVQDKFPNDVMTEYEASQVSGRKGVIYIRGNERKWTRVFEVGMGKLIPQNDLNNARTVITFEGPDSFIRMAQELLGGNSNAVAISKARGDVKIIGEYAVRDFMVFNNLLAKAGRVLSGMNVKVGVGG